MNNEEQKTIVAEEVKQELPSETETKKYNDIIKKLNDIEQKFSEVTFTNKNVELKPQEETKTIKEEFKLG